MESFKVHIIHVGNMANKGTQALLISDVSLIRQIVGGNVAISVSTTDIAGVKKLCLSLNGVTSPMVDIPYEKADFNAQRFGYERSSLRYKVAAIATFFYMFLQIFLSVSSAALINFGMKPLYRRENLNYIKNCDLVVTCSDETFKESSSLLPLNIYWILAWWSMLLSRTSEILVAKMLRKPVVMFPNSVGPFKTVIGRLLSKVALNYYDYILARESVSFNMVKSLGIKGGKILTFDTALVFSSPLISSVIAHGGNGLVGVSAGVYSHSLSQTKIREYVEIHAKALDEFIDKYNLSVVFLPHYISGFQNDDLKISELILDEMKHSSKAEIVETSNVAEFKSLIGKMDMIISSKMHPAVLASSVYVPIVCIAYDHKQTGFFSELGLDECVIQLGEISQKILTRKIEYVWNRKHQIKRLLEKRIPTMQEHVQDSAAFVVNSYMKSSRSQL